MAKFSKLCVGSVYSGFKVLSIDEIPSCNSDGILLMHVKSGMQIFHLLNADEENLFSFGFRTPSENSKGVAHIIEHSVLCGSKNYPLKDPFIKLSNQSVKTFLNAMTFPDKTLYPASSINEKDYFNLMAVYADAVFFPLLKKEAFMQEGCRFELNEKNQLEMQGVVFNEMQGNYSDFNSVVQDAIARKLLLSTSYRFDSGGDPVAIMDLTYEEFLDFYKRHYTAANCFVFLYGNIPTEKQLDFLNEKVLSRLTDFGTDRNYLYDKKTFCSPWEKPIFTQSYAPCIEKDCGNEVLVSWNLGESGNIDNYVKALFIAELLFGHDGSPLKKVLLESNLGKCVSSNCGLEVDYRYLIFTCGLHGVAKKDCKKVENLVLQTLQNICKNGISEADIKSACMSVEFSNREVVRNHGPYSLVLMRRAYRTWLSGRSPVNGVDFVSKFEELRESILKESEYLENLIRKFLIENQNRQLLCVTPSKKLNTRTEKALKQKISSIKNGMNKAEWKSFLENVARENSELRNYQMASESEELCSLIPYVRPKELSVPSEKFSQKLTNISGVDVFESQQNTNGIVYFSILFPVDVVDVNEYPYLHFFSESIIDVGFADMDWAQASAKISQFTGGMGSSLFNAVASKELLEKIDILEKTAVRPVNENCAVRPANNDSTAQSVLYEYNPLLARHYLLLKVKVLQENLQNGLDLLFSLIESVNFNDYKRLTDLVNDEKNDAIESIVPCGYEYALSRASCNFSRAKAIDEIENGLCSVYTSLKISQMDVVQLAQILESIKTKVFSSGMLLSIVGEKMGIEKTEEYLHSRIPKLKETGFYCGKMKKANPIRDEEFYELTKIQGAAEKFEQYLCQTQVGYGAKCFVSDKNQDKKSVIEAIYAHYLANNILWDKVRTVGGAYGVFANSAFFSGIFSLVTYRDPNPEKNLKIIEEVLRDEKELDLSTEEFEKLVTGTFNQEIQPKTPAQKGFFSLVAYLSGISYEKYVQKKEWILQTSLSELNEVKKDLAEYEKNSQNTIFFSKANENVGKIITLRI